MSEVILTGIAIIVPIVVTVYVLQVVLTVVDNALQPFVDLLAMTGVFAFLEDLGLVGFLIDVGVYSEIIGVLTELIALVALVGIILCVGSVAYHPRGERLVDYFDDVVASIPGVGTVYRSFRRMGDIMLDDDVDNFQEVKLVELLGEGSYVIGFRVGQSPPVVREATDDGVVTMFIPFAPNPVTGGFLAYVEEEQLTDVDMTVEEGVRNIITSGVAGHESDRAGTGQSPDIPIDVDLENIQGVFDDRTHLANAAGITQPTQTPDGRSDATDGSQSSPDGPTPEPTTDAGTDGETTRET